MANENNDNVHENSIEDLVARYKDDVELLTKYLGYFELHLNKDDTQQKYNSSDLAHSMSFPVYDSELMNFVRDCESTKMIDRNYVYVYTRVGITNLKDELEFIDSAEIRDIADLAGILSKYIIEGRTKGVVWSEGVKNGVYYKLISKMQELIKKWS